MDRLTSLYEGFRFDTSDKIRVKQVIKKFSFNEAIEALDIAFEHYEDPYEAILKMGGICYNRRVCRVCKEGKQWE